MSAASSKSRRFDRYHAVVQSARAMPEFALDALKQRVREESPAFVTRTVKALVQGGHLQEMPDGRYRWLGQPDSGEIDSWLRNTIEGCQIKSTPSSDRPRERLLANGAASLRTAELLAILIRTGKAGESALQAGERIANHFAETLPMLPTAGRAELKQVSGAVGETAYCQIMAGIELGRRVAASGTNKPPTKINSSADAIVFCEQQFARLMTDGCKEEFHIVCLDTKNQVIAKHQISVGTLDATLIHPREVFRPAIQDAASTVILVHNHPSGDSSPSNEDIQTTKKLEAAGKMVGIMVLDHVVLGAAGSVSLREAGL